MEAGYESDTFRVFISLTIIPRSLLFSLWTSFHVTLFVNSHIPYLHPDLRALDVSWEDAISNVGKWSDRMETTCCPLPIEHTHTCTQLTLSYTLNIPPLQICCLYIHSPASVQLSQADTSSLAFHKYLLKTTKNGKAVKALLTTSFWLPLRFRH